MMNVVSQSSSNSTTTFSIKNFITKHLIVLTVIPLLFFLLIFFHWRGDTFTRFSALDGPIDCSSLAQNNSAPLDEFAAKVMSKSESNSSVLRGWKFVTNNSILGPKICITSTTSAGLEDIMAWIFYHKFVGITNFFLFVEGKAATPYATKVLETIPGVKAIPRTRELEEQQANSRIWNETWLAGAFHKPCNAALFVKQTLNMEMAIAMAREEGMEWILHIDTDELLHPAGTQEYSFRELLGNVSSDVDSVVFLNYEAAVERDNIKAPFTEVSLFKKNLADLPRNYSNYKLLKEAMHNNSNLFLTYANGKSAARIQDHLRPNGAHRWYNYAKVPKEIKINEAVVLHYTYTRFSDLTSRRDRCNCKPTEEDVKRCFYLKFDRSAFIVASTVPQEEMLQWYQEHVVWNNEKLKLRLLKYGILTRIYTPMIIIKNLRESEYFASIVASAQLDQSRNPELVSNMGNNNSKASSSPLSSPSTDVPTSEN